jgi:LysR family transcriptional regulator, hydrogen peroxide-inducible genes activator
VHLPPIRQLQYLVALREQLHFGRAASTLNVSQSTLSTGIRELEKALGIMLVERTNKSVAFTAAGDDIADRARYIIMQAEDLVTEARSFADPLALPIKLGAIPTIAPFLVPDFALQLQQSFAGMQLYIRENTTANLIAELLDNKLDIGLLALPYDVGQVETRVIYREGFSLACHESSRLIDAQNPDFDSLPDESLLLLDDGHCLRDHALAGCRLKGHRQIHTFGANSLQMLIRMVDNDLGVTLVPDMALGLLDNTSIRTTRLPIDQFYRDIGFAWRKGHSRAETLDAIMSLLPFSTPA